MTAPAHSKSLISQSVSLKLSLTLSQTKLIPSRVTSTPPVDTELLEPELVTESNHSNAGRPTLYKPKYCEQVIEVMSQGETLVAFADEIGVNVSSLYEWQDVHPEFSHACARARQAQQRFMERKILNGLDNKNFQASAALTFMRALFPHYREALSPGTNVAVQVNNTTSPDVLAAAKEVAKLIAGGSLVVSNGQQPKQIEPVSHNKDTTIAQPID